MKDYAIYKINRHIKGFCFFIPNFSAFYFQFIAFNLDMSFDQVLDL